MGSPCTMGKEMCVNVPIMLLNKTEVGLVRHKLPSQHGCVSVPTDAMSPVGVATQVPWRVAAVPSEQPWLC